LTARYGLYSELRTPNSELLLAAAPFATRLADRVADGALELGADFEQGSAANRADRAAIGAFRPALRRRGALVCDR
jgi:hypothetical protein